MTLTNLIIASLVLLLLIVLLSQITRIGDLIGGLRKDQEKAEEQDASINGSVFLIVGVIGMALIVWSYMSQGHKYLPEAASELGRDFDFLFYKVFSPPLVIVFFITQILLFYFTYKYRYRKGGKVHYFAHSNKLELIWTSVPLITMVIFGFITIPKWVQATSKPSEDALRIKVTGMQFKWFLAYPGQDNEFGERDILQYGELANLLGLNPQDTKGYDDVYVDELVVPVGKEISFELSALDVIHDFYLPHFRMKMDCVPGVPTRMKIVPDRTTEEMREKTGNPDFEYEIACAELCGTGHWNMRRTIKVVTQAEYDTWFSEQKTAKALYYDALLADLEGNELDEDEHHQEEDVHEEELSHDEDTENDEHHDETASL